MSDINLESFDQDEFNRKIIAKNLTKIIESKDKSMVISLDSDWGTGKTTFVNMWRNMLDKEDSYNTKFNTLYFNAWEHDYIKDPLLAIFSEIESQMKENNPKIKEQLDKVIEKIKPYTKLATTSVIKMLTAGMLDFDKIDLGKFNEDELIKLAGELGGLSIKEISASKQVRTELKKELCKYQESSGKKIIFFIDELDRCRPTFAIELLEVIKHLFNIDNFIFIISIDKEQLSHSVSTIYGQNMDTLGYLRRFFDLDYKLPKIDIKQYTNIKNSNIFKNYINTEYIQVFLKELFNDHKFSLRDIDKTYYYIELILPLIDVFNNVEKNFTNIYILTTSYIYSVLIITKIKKPIIYKKIIDADYETGDILKDFHVPNLDCYDEYIGEYSKDKLHSIITTILEKYLNLNLEIKYIKDPSKFKSSKYSVGLNIDDKFAPDILNFNLVHLFNNSDLNINSRLEFIEGF